MKKLFARTLAGLLALLMLGGCVACGGGGDPTQTQAGTSTAAGTAPSTEAGTEAATEADTEAETADVNVPQVGPFTGTTQLTFEQQEVIPMDRVVSTEYEFISTAESSAIFGIGGGNARGSTVLLDSDGVVSLNVGVKFNEGVVTRYRFHLKAADPMANYDSAYLGLRLGHTGKDPTAQSGIWITMKNQEIGMRAGQWPNVTMLKTEADFAEGCTVYVVDDPTSNVVTMTYDSGDGEEKPLATVKVTDTHIEFYLPGSTKPDIVDPIKNEISTSGYARFWGHYVESGIRLKDIKVSGETTITTTDPVDMLNSRDVFADTWVATDDVGRVTPVGSATPTVGDKQVGLFYFMWHNATEQGQNPLYDHTAAYLEGGIDAVWDLVPQGPLGFAHYWAEPYFGYYNSDDEWVIRKHGYMLAEAGVDFIYVDATNGIIYERNLETLLKVWTEMKAEGYQMPKICFHCGNTDNLAISSLSFLWNNYYSSDKYRDMWFEWGGKVLIFLPDSVAKTMSNEMKEFFTTRQSWAFTSDNWYTSRRGYGRWAWADMYPQGPGLSPDGELEQMIVMCGFWANGSGGTNGGRSYTHANGIPKYEGDWNFGYALMNTTSGLGLAFQEHFDYAMEKDPPLIMITGWNEWWAGRWGGSAGNAAQGQTICNEYRVDQNNPKYQWYYVDAFNTEYSRDLEPMTGGFKDNYYYQMVQNIRKYKGSRAQEAAFGQWAIDIKGDHGQWDIVGPEYRDFAGDTVDRDHFSYVGDFRYTNTSGRNDFVTCKVSSDKENLYFYAECAEAITAPEGTNWMNLFIDADCNGETGWYGYDYVLNRSRADGKVTVEKFVGNDTWAFETVGEAEYDLRDNRLQIKVARSVMSLGDTFDFKWADNSVVDGDVMQFLDQGDAAPDSRYNYRYTTVATEVKLPACLTSDMVVLKAGSYNAFAGGKQVRLDESSTKAVFLGRGENYYLPLTFVEEVLGVSCEGLETFDHYGITYVMPAEAIAATGKTVTVSADGLLVIADAPVTADVLTTLYRALM